MTTETAPPIPDEAKMAAARAICRSQNFGASESAWLAYTDQWLADAYAALTAAWPHLVTAVLDSAQGKAELARRITGQCEGGAA